MTYVFETTIADKAVVVEYVLSSVNGLIKVVDMTVDGKFHRMNWMSKEGQANLMDELERDYMDNHSVMNHPDFVEAFNGAYDSEIDLDRDVPSMVSEPEYLGDR